MLVNCRVVAVAVDVSTRHAVVVHYTCLSYMHSTTLYSILLYLPGRLTYKLLVTSIFSVYISLAQLVALVGYTPPPSSSSYFVG